MSSTSPKQGVILIRHPTTAMNSTDQTEDRIRGHRDIPLDANGKKQAVQLARYAESFEPAEVYTSDLSRSRDMARLIAKACKVKLEVRKEYRPWNLGDFQGQPTSEVLPQLKDYEIHPDKKVPGGESFRDFMERWIGQLRDCLADHVLDGRTIVGVSHYRNVKAAEAWIKAGMPEDVCKLDLPTFQKNDMPNGGMLRIWLEGGQFKYEVLRTPISSTAENIGVPKAPASEAARRIGIKVVRKGLPKAA
jgi:probable phosphoglycerate mutase